MKISQVSCVAWFDAHAVLPPGSAPVSCCPAWPSVGRLNGISGNLDWESKSKVVHITLSTGGKGTDLDAVAREQKCVSSSFAMPQWSNAVDKIFQYLILIFPHSWDSSWFFLAPSIHCRLVDRSPAKILFLGWWHSVVLQGSLAPFTVVQCRGSTPLNYQNEGRQKNWWFKRMFL